MTQPDDVTSATRMLSLLADVEEASFLPDNITRPYEELNNVSTFAELKPLFSVPTLNSIHLIPRRLRILTSNYTKFQESLQETQNVFSSEEDYI